MLQKKTFQSLIDKGIQRFGELPAITLVPSGETTTYNELWKQIVQVASYLLEKGLKKGDRVASIIPNSLESVIFGIAIQHCGGILVPLSEKLGKREVDFILNESKPVMAVVGTAIRFDSFLEYAEIHEISLIGLLEFQVEYPEQFEGFLLSEVREVCGFSELKTDDIALLSYTGGTTGTPKGVMHTQGGLGAAILSAAIEDPLDDRDRLLLSTPIVHSAGSLLWRSLISGVHIYIMRSFNAELFIRTIKEHQITTTFMVPTMLYRLLDQTGHMEYDMSSMRNIYYGASPISQKRLKEAFEVFGPILRQQYGMTECNIVIARLSKSAHHWAYHNQPEVLKSCGKPCLFTEVRLVGDDGNDIGPSELGEIIIKSPAMMTGYYQRPELTEACIRDGWFYTGDIGKWDENGYLYIVDRKKDMIISGGMNVYSSEVERVVNLHPSVALSACIGVPHPDWGESVCVVVSLREGESCTSEEIMEFCKRNTSTYMIPKVVHFLDSFPLTTIGKIDKKELRKRFSEEILTS